MRALSACVLGALGLSVVVIVVMGVVVSAPAAAPARTEQGELVVALHLPAPGLQAGALRGGRVVAARGLEIDVARVLARRLGVRDVRLVNIADARALTRAGAKRWDLALAGIDARTTGGVDMSTAYLTADPVVLMRPGLGRPASLAELRRRTLCLIPGTRAAAVARRLLPQAPVVEAQTDTELVRLAETGSCDAAVREAPQLGTTLRRTGVRHGPLGGRIDTGAGYAVALPQDSELVPDVDRVLTRLRANRTLEKIALRWLGFDPARLRVLARAR
jgi:ABC-type amino acid transport substrate-binding protein